MGLLGEIFSAGDSAKRKLKGLLSDPLGELGLLGTRMAEDIQNQLDAYSKAYPLDPRLAPRLDTAQGREMVVDQNVARNKLAEMAANMGMAGTFIGPTARTWDALAAKRAQDLYAKKVDPRAIWKETGTFKGPDGMWRQEIPDNQAVLDVGALLDGPRLVMDLPKADAVMEHAGLLKSYPDVMTGTYVGKTKSGGGSFSDMSNRGAYKGMIEVNPSAPESPTSIALHELQHAIQQREGWARGGSPDVAFRDPRMWGGGAEGSDIARKMLKDKLKEMSTPMPVEKYAKDAWQSDVVTPEILAAYKDYAKTIKSSARQFETEAQKTVAQEWYRRLAGEAEARATQSRMNMDAAKRREVFPLDSYDVPLNELIIRLGAKP